MQLKLSKKQMVIGGVVLLVFAISVGVLMGGKGVQTEVYTNTDYGIRFNYPADWEIVDNTVNGFFAVSCMHKELSSAILSIQVLDVGGVGLEDYTKGFIDGTLKNDQIIESSAINLANNPGHKIVYEAGASNADGSGRYMLAYTIKGAKSYILDFSSADGNYSAFLPAVEKIVDSFQITK